jgi:hypothetical protein
LTDETATRAQSVNAQYDRSARTHRERLRMVQGEAGERVLSLPIALNIKSLRKAGT